MRISTFFPLVCASAALVLSILCIVAGYKPGFLEEYSIISVRSSWPPGTLPLILMSCLQLNTSTLGHNIVPTTIPTSGSTPSLGSILGNIARDLRSSIGGEIAGELDGVVGDAADKLAADLGIQQWYSMHLMDMCEGTYNPDATAPRPQRNVSSCTKPTAMCKCRYLLLRLVLRTV